jgi:hypothetical protein
MSIAGRIGRALIWVSFIGLLAFLAALWAYRDIPAREL